MTHSDNRNRLSKKVFTILFIVCSIGILMGIIGIAKAVYVKKNTPSEVQNAAYEYLIRNDELTKRHGHGFEVRFLDISLIPKKHSGHGAAEITCEIGQEKYTVNLVCRNERWNVEDIRLCN